MLVVERISEAKKVVAVQPREQGKRKKTRGKRSIDDMDQDEG